MSKDEVNCPGQSGTRKHQSGITYGLRCYSIAHRALKVTRETFCSKARI